MEIASVRNIPDKIAILQASGSGVRLEKLKSGIIHKRVGLLRFQIVDCQCRNSENRDEETVRLGDREKKASRNKINYEQWLKMESVDMAKILPNLLPTLTLEDENGCYELDG